MVERQADTLMAISRPDFFDLDGQEQLDRRDLGISYFSLKENLFVTND